MIVRFACPRCQRTTRQSLEPGRQIRCDGCDWTRPVSSSEFTGARPNRCLVCGCTDLWKQKDFPKRVGVLFVVLAAVGSTVCIAQYRPAAAFAVLLGFALVDLLLYTLMPDVLVCYRCETRFQDLERQREHPRFNLETAERYRQEAARLADSRASNSPSQP